jgi:uncharacterized protein
MIKYFLITTLLFLNLIAFGQEAEELNEQSKALIELGKFDEALPLLKKAAEMGSPEAQYNLGYSYQAGIGVGQNSFKAFAWYLKAAENDWNDGLFAVMMAYANGDGVEQSMASAFDYALKCGSNKDVTCMYNVISCYKEGIGTEKDLQKMLEWAVRLGSLENPENLHISGKITSARLNLAHMFRDGNDVEKDLLQSYAWFLIYNESKIDFSYFQQQEIIKEIQELEKILEENQIPLTKKKAQELLGRPLQNLKNLYKAEV